MRITRLETLFIKPRWSIVKIHTDEGITGIGEAACDQTEPVEVVRAMIDRHMAPKLIGEDPLDW